MLNLNLRRIAYYIPYSRQVLPKRRNIVRMNLKPSVEEDSQMEDVQQPGRILEENGIPKEEILLTWKVTKMG
jgi:hypothetical protein